MIPTSPIETYSPIHAARARIAELEAQHDALVAALEKAEVWIREADAYNAERGHGPAAHGLLGELDAARAARAGVAK